VLADVGADGNLEPDSVASRITERTRALLPVHLGGNPCRMEELWGLARRHGLFVVEDAAHALGSRYGASWVGGDSRSDAVVFSFYATKSLTTGEGGMITSHRGDLRERMRILGHHGIDRAIWQRQGAANEWAYSVGEAGFKFNLSDLQSAIGLEQLKKQDDFLAARIQHARLYERELAGIEGAELPSETAADGHCWHLYRLALRLERLAVTRDEFIREMKRRGVSCSVHFMPVPLQPFFADVAGRPENLCLAAMALYPRLVSLPIYPAMSAEDVRYVAWCVREVIDAACCQPPQADSR
jgi:dTDP-4-amino-4,6-dideoxygalactose transaminase